MGDRWKPSKLKPGRSGRCGDLAARPGRRRPRLRADRAGAAPAHAGALRLPARADAPGDASTRACACARGTTSCSSAAARRTKPASARRSSWSTSLSPRGKAAYDRLVLAGFSQGGAIVLQTALRHPERLAGRAGVIDLSAAGRDSWKRNATRQIATCRSSWRTASHDDIIPIDRARQLARRCWRSWATRSSGTNIRCRTPCAPEEIADISAFLVRIL